MRIDVFHHFPTRDAQLDRIERALARLIHEGNEMALDLSTLTADVTANTDAVSSATVLLGELADELRAAAGDPAAVAALADTLEANTASLAAAVAANTPAAPAA